MHTHTHRRLPVPFPIARRASLATALALGLLAAAPLPAQDAGPARTQRRAEPLLDIDFASGTLPEFIAHLRDRAKGVNIVLGEGAGNVAMPSIKLLQVEIEDALQTAAMIASNDRWQVQVKSNRSATGTSIHTVLVREIQNVPTQVTRGGFAGAGNRPETAVFSLRQLTTQLPGGEAERSFTIKAETALSAIETGLQLGEGPPPVLRYHADSGLLFAHGPSHQLAVVSSVLRQLERDQATLREAARPAEKGKPAEKKDG